MSSATDRSSIITYSSLLANRVDSIFLPAAVRAQSPEGATRIIGEFRVYEGRRGLGMALPFIHVADGLCHFLKSFHLGERIGPAIGALVRRGTQQG